ncbi:hypothetical protein V6N13_074350 [Hibiscus sabdariffa]
MRTHSMFGVEACVPEYGTGFAGGAQQGANGKPRSVPETGHVDLSVGVELLTCLAWEMWAKENRKEIYRRGRFGFPEIVGGEIGPTWMVG